jgi:hypothetical protein
MHNRNELKKKIQAYLPLHGARAAFMMRFVMAVVVVRGVTASTVASVLNPRVLLESNEKRIKRFFREVELEGEGFAKLMLALLPEKSNFVLTLDRTTWELGSVCINILLLGVAYNRLSAPPLQDLRISTSSSLTYKFYLRVEAVKLEVVYFRGLECFFEEAKWDNSLSHQYHLP